MQLHRIKDTFVLTLVLSRSLSLTRSLRRESLDLLVAMVIVIEFVENNLPMFALALGLLSSSLYFFNRCLCGGKCRVENLANKFGFGSNEMRERTR